MEMEGANRVKNEGAADSPTSVLEDEEVPTNGEQCFNCREENGMDGLNDVKSLHLGLEAKNGDATLITKAMEEEEQNLLEARMKEEVDGLHDVKSLHLELEAKNGDATLITKAMEEEEQKLLEARMKEEVDARQEVTVDIGSRFKKLEDLLTQTEIYSQFLLEKMDNITEQNSTEIKVEEEDTSKEKKTGRGRKRKSTSQYNSDVQ